MSVDCGKCVNRHCPNVPLKEARKSCFYCLHEDESIASGGVRVDNYKEEITTETSPLDTQIGGDHYKKMGAYQPWEVLAKWLTPEELKGFMKGTVISYLAREDDKGGRADIEKAHHTMGLYLELTK